MLWLSCIWLKSSIFRTVVLFFGPKMLGFFTVDCFDALFILVDFAMNTATFNTTESRAQEIRVRNQRRFLKTIILIPSVLYYHVNTFIDFWKHGLKCL